MRRPFSGLLDPGAMVPTGPSASVDQDFAPIQLSVSGILQTLLRGVGFLESEFQTNRRSVIQGIRYYCGDPAWARIVRIELQFPSGLVETLTPAGDSDEWQIWRPIGGQQRFKARLVLSPTVNPGAVPVIADPATVLLEVFG
jgi:hypothetical protein